MLNLHRISVTHAANHTRVLLGTGVMSPILHPRPAPQKEPSILSPEHAARPRGLYQYAERRVVCPRLICMRPMMGTPHRQSQLARMRLPPHLNHHRLKCQVQSEDRSATCGSVAVHGVLPCNLCYRNPRYARLAANLPLLVI